MASPGEDSLPLQPPRRASSIRALYFNVAANGLSTNRSLISGGISPGRRTDGPTSRGADGPFYRSKLASVAHAYPFSLFNSPVPDSSADPLIDVETGCGPWGALAGKPARPWIQSKLQRKARNPTACDSIGYEVVHQNLVWKSLAFAAVMAMWSMAVPILLTWLKKLQDKTGLSFLPRMELFTFVMFWVEGIVALALAFLYSLGFHSIHNARTHMKNLQHSVSTTAYSFLKTLCDKYRTVSELQPLVYECLALLTAYPVALIQQFKGNNCEPDVTRYCKETAMALWRIRDNNGFASTKRTNKAEVYVSGADGHHDDIRNVDCFFEVFSLQLEMEYASHHMSTQIPSLVPEHIVYNLRSHFENVNDYGNILERRIPIVRENLDLMALAGRQLGAMSLHDAHPHAMLWIVDLLTRLSILTLPLQLAIALYPPGSPGAQEHDGRKCTTYFIGGEGSNNPGALPATLCWASLDVVILSSVAGALGFVILHELWGCWDPFGRGLNTFEWTLRIAMEIDTMLNEFYESDENAIVRRHSYHDPDERHRFCGLSNSTASLRPVYTRSYDQPEDNGRSSFEERPQTT